MPNPGDVILANIPFTDENRVKKRPALVLFEEYDNVVVAGITSNELMDGVPLTKEDGAIKESVIKLNYIFTIASGLIEKHLFRLNQQKQNLVFDELVKKLQSLSI